MFVRVRCDASPLSPPLAPRIERMLIVTFFLSSQISSQFSSHTPNLPTFSLSRSSRQQTPTNDPLSPHLSNPRLNDHHHLQRHSKAYQLPFLLSANLQRSPPPFRRCTARPLSELPPLPLHASHTHSLFHPGLLPQHRHSTENH